MAAVTRNDMNANVLQTWLNRKVLKTLEPKLYFFQFGEKPMVEDGYNTIAWAKYDQIATSSVTTGTTSNDGVTPDDTAFNATVVSVSPTQYRIVVSLSDMVIERNVINFVEGAAIAVGNAMARKIDAVIQTTIMAGTNVYYGGTAAARSSLAATDVLTTALLNKTSSKLISLNADPMDDGYFVAVIHPYQLYDLRASTAAGSWLDVNKYAQPGGIYKGEIGLLFGVRIIVSSFVQTFSSTVTVYPALVFGKGAYGVGSFQTLKSYVTPAVSSDSDPLAQRRKVGAKVAFGTQILQQNCMYRIETGATAL